MLDSFSSFTKNILVITLSPSISNYCMLYNACKTYNNLVVSPSPIWPLNSNFLIAKIIRKILLLLFPYSIFFFLKIPLKNIKKCSCIITHDNIYSFYNALLLNEISKKFKDKRLIVYYMNKVNDEESHYNFFKKIRCELWSFDKNDCFKFGLNYNKTFIMANHTSSQEITTDVFFLGMAKGRTDSILKIKQILEKLNLSTDIRIINNEEAMIPYIQVCELVEKSIAILDVVINGQEGATQREMEALLYRKKLITTNEFVKSRDYYNENNIYYLDLNQSDHNDLVDFLRKPLHEVDENIIESYSYNAWVNRFFEEKEK